MLFEKVCFIIIKKIMDITQVFKKKGSISCFINVLNLNHFYLEL